MPILRSILVYAKVWSQRTMSWVAIVNTAILLFLFLSKLQDYGITIYITKWYFPILIGTVAIMIFFGYLEDRAGFFSEESRVAAKKNPYFDEILQRLNRIEKKVEKKNRKKG